MRDWKAWIKAAGTRAVKTMAQTALGLFTVGDIMADIDWGTVFSASLVAGIYSLLMSLKGLPELKGAEQHENHEEDFNE